MTTARARIGLVGLSGYAAELLGLLLAETVDPEGASSLAAVYAPDAAQLPEVTSDLAERGIGLCGSFESLIDRDGIDAVWLPVPIHLHRSMATAVLEAGRALVLEKPVAGSVADHRAISAAAAQAGRRVCVGFQDVYAPSTAAIKAGLLAGRFGAPRRVAVLGSWPRSAGYFARNRSAGRLEVDGVPVRDSPLANAMAHFVNLAIFLCGGAMQDAAVPRAVSAELLRAHAIESFDTCSIRCELESTAHGVIELTINLTHAAGQTIQPRIDIETDRGVLGWRFGGGTGWIPAGGVHEVLFEPALQRPPMVRTIGQLLGGGLVTPEHGLVADLDNSLSHTRLVELVHEASGGGARIGGFDPASIIEPDDPATQPLAVRGLEEALRRAFRQRSTLGEAGWTVG